MFNAVLHCASADIGRAREVKRLLENLGLKYLGIQFHVSVALLLDVTCKTPVETLREVLENEMTTLFIIICTANYQNDQEARTLENWILNARAKSASLDVIHLRFDEREEAEATSDNMTQTIVCRPNSEIFQEQIERIIGTHFRETLQHDRVRRTCEDKFKQWHRSNSFQGSSSVRAKETSLQRENTVPRSSRTRANSKTGVTSAERHTEFSSSTDDENRLAGLHGSRGLHKGRSKSSEEDTHYSESSCSSVVMQSTDIQPSSSSGHQGDVSNSSDCSIATGTDKDKAYLTQHGQRNRARKRVSGSQGREKTAPKTVTGDSTTTHSSPRVCSTSTLGQPTVTPPTESADNIASNPSPQNENTARVSSEEIVEGGAVAAAAAGSDFIPLERENESRSSTSSDLWKTKTEKSLIRQFNDIPGNPSSESAPDERPKRWPIKHVKRLIDHFRGVLPSSSGSLANARERRGSFTSCVSSSSSQEHGTDNSTRRDIKGATRLEKANAELGVNCNEPQQPPSGREAHTHEATAGSRTASRGFASNDRGATAADNNNLQHRPADRTRQVAFVAPMAADPLEDQSDSSETCPKTYAAEVLPVQRPDARPGGDLLHAGEVHAEGTAQEEDNSMTASGVSGVDFSSPQASGENDPAEPLLRYVCTL